jgi:tetratricopeptide (TPR) repeat protein
MLNLSYSLAKIYISKNKFEDADNYLEKALILLKLQKNDNPVLLLAILNDLVMVNTKLHDNAKAAEYNNKIVEVSQRIHAPDSVEHIEALEAHAEALKESQEFAEATALYEKTLLLKIKKHGELSKEVCDTLLKIGILYDYQGEDLKAVNIFQKLLDVRVRLYGQEKPQLVVPLVNMARSYEKLSDYKISYHYYEQAAKVYLKNEDTLNLNYRKILDSMKRVEDKMRIITKFKIRPEGEK